MLEALAEGTAAPAAVAGLAKRRLRRNLDRLRPRARRTPRRAPALAAPDAHPASGGDRARRRRGRGRDRRPMRPFAARQALLVTIPGVDALTAAIIAEIGADMAAFGTARRLAAWAGLCPASHESAGKRTKRGTREGHPHLEAALVTAPVCAARTEGGTCLRDKFHRPRAAAREAMRWGWRTRDLPL